jgi:hypothetical protein
VYSQQLIEKWITAFGKDVDIAMIDKYVTSSDNYLWHLFTWCDVSCTEGDKAREFFDNLKYEEAIKFYGGRSNHIENASLVGKISSKDLDEDIEADVYVVAKDFSWTYVRTHERDLCGPFFCGIEVTQSYKDCQNLEKN